MSTNNASTSTRADAATHEEFLDVILADDELLRAEFDAIIADAWPDPPRAAAQPPHRRLRTWGRGRIAQGPHRPGLAAWARQRSPPPRQ
jgi:hypothetical protein